MISPRWRKILRDIAGNKRRTAFLVLALAAGNLAFATVLGADAILVRELDRNYLETRPATATFTLDRVDVPLLEKLRRRPGVKEAEARTSIVARAKVGEEWRPLLLFAVDDFQSMRLAMFRSAGGAWPPPTGTMLLERSAGGVLKAGIGDVLALRVPGGTARPVPISGLAHDPSLAPAWMERTGYAYVSRETLKELGGPAAFDEVRVLTSGDADAVVRDLARWLQGEGRIVERICVPPAGRHPHQGQLEGILAALGSFSLLLLALGAVLVGTLIGAVMAREVREIGVMKTIGARSGQVAFLYLSMVLAIAAIAFGATVGPGVITARAYAATLAELLNFTIASNAIPPWVFVVEAFLALIFPLMAALVPVWRASRIPVRAALDDFGVRGGERFGESLGRLNRIVLLSLRNVARRRARLLPTVILLALAGALLMTALNLAAGWRARAAEIGTTQRYDVEFRLAEAEPIEELLARVRRAQSVRVAEAWGAGTAAIGTADGVAIERTYPDRGHGSLRLLAPPRGSSMVDLPLIEGRWLRDDDAEAVVIGHGNYGVGVGGRLTLSIGGRVSSWQVIGRVREVGPAAVYVTYEAFARATATEGKAAMLRVSTTARTPEERRSALRQIDEALDAVNVTAGLPLSELLAAIEAHVVIFIVVLSVMAGIIGAVGLLGLASVMSINVLERAREFEILWVIGATPAQIRWIVILESLLIAAVSGLGAVTLSLPLSVGAKAIFGKLAFGLPVPFAVSPLGIAIWLCVLGVVAPLSVWAAAGRAARAGRTEPAGGSTRWRRRLTVVGIIVLAILLLLLVAMHLGGHGPRLHGG